MSDCSLNMLAVSVSKRILFSPKYRDRRLKVHYNLFDGSKSCDSRRKYRRTRGRYDLLKVSLSSDPYGCDIGVVGVVGVDAVPPSLRIGGVVSSSENE